MAQIGLICSLLLSILGTTVARDFQNVLSKFVSTTKVRSYKAESTEKLNKCCGLIDEKLQTCLMEASETIILNNLPMNNDCIAITMMTSSRLSESYSVYSEASTALWASQQSEQLLHNGKCLEFIVAEVDDGEGGTEFGTAYTDASGFKQSRVPHWLKVPLIASLIDKYPTVLYVDADATVVHTHSSNWFIDLLESQKEYNVVITRDAEGNKELIYNENGAPRLNDATYVNTGILLLKQQPSNENNNNNKWCLQFLESWWEKGNEETSYLFGRTYDQGAMGHLFFTHGTPMRRKQPSSSSSFSSLSAKEKNELIQERQSNLEKQLWRSKINVIEPEIMNNHAPGGSFLKPNPNHSSDSKKWWCQHFIYPILQLSGQSNSIRREILSRIWNEGACFQITSNDITSSSSSSISDESEEVVAMEVDSKGGSVSGAASSASQGKTPSCKHLAL